MKGGEWTKGGEKKNRTFKAAERTVRVVSIKTEWARTGMTQAQ